MWCRHRARLREHGLGSILGASALARAVILLVLKGLTLLALLTLACLGLLVLGKLPHGCALGKAMISCGMNTTLLLQDWL